MYVPKFNAVTDKSRLDAHIESNPFGSWSCMANGEIVVNHLPFVFRADEGSHGTIYGHVSRANPVWEACSTKDQSVVVFHGEHAYISPSWYPSKQLHGKAVPTWNYTVVHVRGIPVFRHEPEWLLGHLRELTEIHEKDQQKPWTIDDAPKDFIDRLVGAIVGIEIPINSITGKWKLGQNRPTSDQQGTVEGLLSKKDDRSRALGQLTRRYCSDE